MAAPWHLSLVLGTILLTYVQNHATSHYSPLYQCIDT